MARARFIRPEFFTDEKVGELSYGARLLFVGIWCHADLNGIFEYSSKQLRVLLFPFDEGLSSSAIQEWLDDLERREMISRFEYGGKPWGAVTKWRVHQSISTKEKQIGTKRPLTPPPGHARDMPSPDPGQVWVSPSTPSPSPAPAPSTSPAPAPAGEKPLASTQTATPGAGGVRHRIVGYDLEAIQAAIDQEDPLALIRAFGGIVTEETATDWLRDADGMQLGELAIVLYVEYFEKRPVRYPSGLRTARADWNAVPFEARKQEAAVIAEKLGLTSTQPAF